MKGLDGKRIVFCQVPTNDTSQLKERAADIFSSYKAYTHLNGIIVDYHEWMK